MKYGSVCSGIEAASVAWESLGWQAQWYSEIEHFPSAVLAHRFPAVPNLGDMTQIHNSEHFNGNSIDLLVGGTPCQSFSVAGLRKGLDDTRGQLMLTFCELAARKRPRWVVWENVPGVLSSNKGEDLASFLGLLTGREIHPPVGGWKNSGVVEGIGSAYGVAWTVLDAQYFGVAQRRRRIFAVGYLGDWRPAAAVLFESYRLSGDIKESRKKRKATSSDAEGGSGGRGFRMTAFGEYADDDSASTLKQRDYKDATDLAVETKASWWNGEQTAATLTKQNANGAQRMPDKDNLGAVLQPVPFRKAKRAQSKDDHETWEQDEKTNTLNAFDTGDIRTTQAVVQPIAVDTYNQTTSNINQTIKSPQGGLNESIGVVLQPIAVDTYNQTINEHTTQTIRTQSHSDQIGAVLQPIAVDTYNQTVNENSVQTIRSDGNHTDRTGAVLTTPTIIDRAAFNQGENAQYDIKIEEGETMPSLVARGPHGVGQSKPPTMAIRRLLPTECEILQGFPRNWTLIPYRGKPAEQCPDGPRYKACGNSMAVPCMFWLGKRIQMVEDIINNKAI